MSYMKILYLVLNVKKNGKTDNNNETIFSDFVSNLLSNDIDLDNKLYMKAIEYALKDKRGRKKMNQDVIIINGTKIVLR